MKLSEMGALYTDYPFLELGDTPGEIAPVREIILLSYDGDKYCDVLVEGVRSVVKSGYIYAEPGRCGEVAPINIEHKQGARSCTN